MPFRMELRWQQQLLADEATVMAQGGGATAAQGLVFAATFEPAVEARAMAKQSFEGWRLLTPRRLLLPDLWGQWRNCFSRVT